MGFGAVGYATGMIADKKKKQYSLQSAMVEAMEQDDKEIAD